MTLINLLKLSATYYKEYTNWNIRAMEMNEKNTTRNSNIESQFSSIEERAWSSILLGISRVDDNGSYFISFLVMLTREGVVKDFNSLQKGDFRKELYDSIISSNSIFKKQLIELLQIFDDEIEVFGNSVLDRNLWKLRFPAFEDPDFNIGAVNIEDFLPRYPFSLRHSNLKLKYNDAGYSSPKLNSSLVEFIYSLADLNDQAEIFQPYAGTGKIINFLKADQKYLGQEYDKSICAEGILRLVYNKKKGNWIINNKDSLVSWPSFESKFDLVFAAPEGRVYDNRFILRHQSRDILSLTVLNGIKSLKSNGKFIAVLPVTILFSEDEYALRKMLLENGLIDYIIALPAWIASGSILMVCSKLVKQTNGIKLIHDPHFAYEYEDEGTYRCFIDIPRMLKLINGEIIDRNVCKVISTTEIKKNDYNLRFGRYFDPALPTLNKGERFIRLGQLLSLAGSETGANNRYDYQVKKVSNYVPTNQIKAKAIDLDNLKQSLLDFRIKDYDIKEADTMCYLTPIEKSVLFIPMDRDSSLIPTYFEYDGIPIYELNNSSILAFDIDQKQVDLTYLVNELNTWYIKRQINPLKDEYEENNFNIRDFLDVKIRIMPIKRQKEIAAEAIEKLKKEEKEKIKKSDTVERQLGGLRHRASGRLSVMDNALSEVDEIIELINDKTDNDVNELRPDEDSRTLRENLDAIKRSFTSINSLLEKVNIASKDEHTDIGLYELLEEYTQEIERKTRNVNDEASMSFNVNFIHDFGKENDIDEIKIHGSKEDLITLLDNFKQNAEKHAFHMGDDNKLQIKCSLIKEDEPKVQISISNTGKPLPKKFVLEDLTTIGFTSDKKKGDGIGGHWIETIIKSHEGSLSFKDHSNENVRKSNFVTSFCINLPVKQILKRNNKTHKHD